MAQQVPLHNSLFYLLIAFVFGCNANKQEDNVKVDLPFVDKTTRSFSIQDGIVMLDNKTFSGTCYTLFAGTQDTAELAVYRNGKENGEWRQYYSSNKLKERRYFIAGQKTGEFLRCWENGNKQLQYFFENDEYEGTCREWNETGMLNKEMNYKKGHEEGRQQWWYDNGKIKANYIIKNGRRFGLLGTKNCINVSDSIFNK